MKDLRRPLGLLAILGFAVVSGWLAWAGHTPIAIGLIAAAAGFAAVMTLGSRNRDLQAARRMADLARETRRMQRSLTRAKEKAAARDHRAVERDHRVAARDQRLLERVEEMERRLLASFEAERLRAAQRHREEMDRLDQP